MKRLTWLSLALALQGLGCTEENASLDDAALTAADAFVDPDDGVLVVKDAFVDPDDGVLVVKDAAVPDPDDGVLREDAVVWDAAPDPDDGVLREDADLADAWVDLDSENATPDVYVPEPDAYIPEPDAYIPEPDAYIPEPDAYIPDAYVPEQLFSFFVTSLDAMRRHSGSQNGFGGNLGGLAGADALCQTIAEEVGQGHKTWRAFLSATTGPSGQAVHAIERIGSGPWYDANGLLVANNVAGLAGLARPAGDARTINDLPDEFGIPLSTYGDSHDVMTGSNGQGRLNSNSLGSTCNDWTSASGSVGNNTLMCGHAWPRSNRDGRNWVSDHALRGCAPGVNLRNDGPGSGNCVGCSGGYGAIYCFALTP